MRYEPQLTVSTEAKYSSTVNNITSKFFFFQIVFVPDAFSNGS